MGETHVSIVGQIVTVVAPDRPGVFSRVAGALALHGIEIVDANLGTADGMAIDQIRITGGSALRERPTPSSPTSSGRCDDSSPSRPAFCVGRSRIASSAPLRHASSSQR